MPNSMLYFMFFNGSVFSTKIYYNKKIKSLRYVFHVGTPKCAICTLFIDIQHYYSNTGNQSTVQHKLPIERIVKIFSE